MGKYTSIHECPVTGEQILRCHLYGNDGICPHCGAKQGSSICHSRQIVGRFARPEGVPRWMFWVQRVWVPKDGA